MSGEGQSETLEEALQSLHGDRGRQAAVLLWIATGVVVSVGLATGTRDDLLRPSVIAVPALMAVVYGARWVVTAWRLRIEDVLGYAARRLALNAIPVLVVFGVGWLIAPVVPDDISLMAAAWISALALGLTGLLLWDHTSLARLRIAGAVAGLLLAYGSVAWIAVVDGPAALAGLVGIALGLAVLLSSVRLERRPMLG